VSRAEDSAGSGTAPDALPGETLLLIVRHSECCVLPPGVGIGNFV
jgi:hypothetical protein